MGLAVLASALAAPAPVAFHRAAEVRQARVALGDIADVSGLPAALRARAAALPVAELPPGGRLILTSARLTERARALMPALAPWLPAGGPERITVRLAQAPVTAPPAPMACVRLIHPLAAGAVPVPDDFAPAACAPGAASDAFRYDPAARAVRATRGLAEGEIAPAVPRFALAAVRPGQRMFVRTQAGPVVVEREVEALQPARAGGQLFVRSAEGEVFPARFEEARP